MSSRWTARVSPGWEVDAWRAALGAALRAELPPESVDWLEDDVPALFAAPDVAAAPLKHDDLRLPRAFVDRATTALCHTDPARLPLLHRIGWRLAHGERGLLADPADPDGNALDRLEREVRRDTHKMKAFVRFAECTPGSDEFVAWFEPSHRIVDRVAPFFHKRFAGMRWAIFTPYRSAAWDGRSICFGPGALRVDLPQTDDAGGESLWRTYYAHIFNPARVNPDAMQREMPKKYWKHLPEAALIPSLIREAPSRAQAMQDAMPTQPSASASARGRQAWRDRTLDRDATMHDAREEAPQLAAMRRAAAACRDCELWQPATQTVFGEGPAGASLMLVGEAPGDREDLSGRPFVGPAGKLLDRALEEAGLDRASIYVTSAVKHFHYERSGKARLHRKPRAGHVRACRQWLEGELAAVRPHVVVCLGGTAAQAMLGEPVSTLAARGEQRMLKNGANLIITVHPAWVLRQPTGEAQDAALRMLVDDLQLAAATIAMAAE
jgi:DNA polymerase